MRSINVLVKPASGNCNMTCKYCFYCDEAAKREQASYGIMDEKSLKNLVRKTVLAAEESCSLAFQGGEPTLAGIDYFRKMLMYAAHYNKHNINISFALQTNGYGITEEWARFFAENHFLIGVSVDGTKEIHDKYRRSRGKNGPTYDRILETTKLFDRYHVDYNILTVVHREVAGNIKEIYKEYKKRGWRWLQFITCLDPVEEVRGNNEWSLTPEVYGRFLIDLFDMWYMDFKRGDVPYVRQFENYLGILLGMGAESCEQRGICGLQYVVEADGSVYPCDFYAMDEYLLGNFNTNSIQEIDEKRKEIGYIERSYMMPEQCQRCPYLMLCRNGCYRSRVHLATERASGNPAGMEVCPGNENSPDLVDEQNYFCKGYKMFFEACGERLKEVAETIRKRG